MKVVTICGSMKFRKEMMKIADELEIVYGFCVLQCVYNLEDLLLTENSIENLSAAHIKKIDLCDMIYVVNVGGYIGESVGNEIAYAKKQGKEILYLEKLEN